MRRDLTRLASDSFDVLVIGGGIYGLIIACDCAMRGLPVALVERHDFGSGASFNHLRTIHGGLRYLQSLDVARARESVLERRTLARIAAPFVRPQAFVLPLSPSLMRGRLALRAGFLLDAIVARDRNDGVPASHRLPQGRVIGRAEAIERFPTLQKARLTGAAIWYDYVTTEADRLTLSWALAASKHGAALANYVEATSLSLEGGRAIGVRALDQLTGQPLEIRARVIVNAAGGAVDRLLRKASIKFELPMLKAMNVVTSRLAPPVALGGRSKSGRNLFQVPWQGRSLFGTWESTRRVAPDNIAVQDSDLDAFVRDINYAFPSAGLTTADITLVHRGIVPAVARSDGSVKVEGHEKVFDHSDHGVEGLLTVAGTKYTTARAVAERVTNRILAKLRRPPVTCRTGIEPLTASSLTGDDLLAAAARDEMVMTLEDAVVRRTPLGALGYPGDAALDHAAQLVGSTLGWDEQTKSREIDAVRRFYGTLKA